MYFQPVLPSNLASVQDTLTSNSLPFVDIIKTAIAYPSELGSFDDGQSKFNKISTLNILQDENEIYALCLIKHLKTLTLKDRAFEILLTCQLSHDHSLTEPLAVLFYSLFKKFNPFLVNTIIPVQLQKLEHELLQLGFIFDQDQKYRIHNLNFLDTKKYTLTKSKFNLPLLKRTLSTIDSKFIQL